MIRFNFFRLSSRRDPQLFCLNGSLPGALNKVRVPLEYRTLRENRADFNADAVSQCGHRSRDFDRFVQVVGMQDEITAHRFFRFGKWTVHHESPVRAEIIRPCAPSGCADLILPPSLSPSNHAMTLSMACRSSSGIASVPMRASE